MMLASELGLGIHQVPPVGDLLLPLQWLFSQGEKAVMFPIELRQQEREEVLASVTVVPTRVCSGICTSVTYIMKSSAVELGVLFLYHHFVK